MFVICSLLSAYFVLINYVNCWFIEQLSRVYEFNYASFFASKGIIPRRKLVVDRLENQSLLEFQ